MIIVAVIASLSQIMAASGWFGMFISSRTLLPFAMYCHVSAFALVPF